MTPGEVDGLDFSSGKGAVINSGFVDLALKEDAGEWTRWPDPEIGV